MSFKSWIESFPSEFQPLSGKPIPPQSGLIIILRRHPRNPNVLWEPAEEPYKEAGEMAQRVRLYQ